LDTSDVRGLLGLLLVDGSLVPYRSPGGGYVQLTLTAGSKQATFLEEKVEEFKQFVPTRALITPYKTTPRANGKRTKVLRFRVSSNKLRPLYNLLYPGGERCITQTALDLLGAQAAAWCWAEGARIHKNGTATLARVGATRAEAGRLQSWLEMLTGAQSELVDGRTRPRLLFDKEQTAKIRAALASYAPRTRIHLFQGDIPDVSEIRSARTELLLGSRINQPEREKAEALVRDRSV
tara:strand:- start:905 stop:1612 length:708 start_codon:yes stop_codon:yes gene_type:complete